MAIRSVRLSESPAPAATSRERKARSVPEPAQQLYGVFGPGYGNYLANTAQAQGPNDSAALAAFNALALRNEAGNERDAYEAMLTRAQDLQRELAAQEISGDHASDIIQYGPNWIGKGAGRAIVPEGSPYASMFDPSVIRQADNAVLNESEADRFKTVSEGLGTLGTSVNIRPDLGYISKLITNPNSDPAEGPVPIEEFVPYAQETTRYGTDEGMSVEEQFRLQELVNAGKGEGEDDVELKINYGATGEVPTLEYKSGDPAAIERARRRMQELGYNPNTGQKLNPKAGATGGDASATPAAPKNKTTQRVEMAPSEGFFAPEKITSKRGMRKHPIDGVVKMHEGDDYAYPKGTPIPAERNGVVLFSGPVSGYGNQVKVRYEDGSVVSYSHNASNSVKIGDKISKGQVIGKVGSTGKSTGSHVHRQIHAQGNPEKVYATRLKQHPMVQDVQVLDDRTLVTTKSGKQLVFQKGKRIG